MTPSFKYVSDKDRWEGEIFCPLLMRHGPPPKGVKWYGKKQRVHFTDPDSFGWNDKIAEDCIAAVESTTILSHYKPLWRERHALNIKNRFIRWCRDGQR